MNAQCLSSQRVPEVRHVVPRILLRWTFVLATQLLIPNVEVHYGKWFVSLSTRHVGKWHTIITRKVDEKMAEGKELKFVQENIIWPFSLGWTVKFF